MYRADNEQLSKRMISRSMILQFKGEILRINERKNVKMKERLKRTSFLPFRFVAF